MTGINAYAQVDMDDTIKEVHGYQMQSSGYGYSGVPGLHALLGIVSSATTASITIGSRLRKGAAGSPRGAGKFVGDILTTVRRLLLASASGLVLVRADSAFYGHAVVSAVHRDGMKVSIRPDGPGRQTCHRHHQRRRVDDDQRYERDSG